MAGRYPLASDPDSVDLLIWLPGYGLGLAVYTEDPSLQSIRANRV